MKKVVLGVVAVLVLSSAAYLARGQAPAPVADAAKVRVGTYDPRAVAVAFVASEFNPVRAKMKEHQEAKAAGDGARVAELEAWGKTYQRQLHFQGFGRAPVGDLLAPVREGVAGVAQAEGLAAIAMECDFVADGVEKVDVTDKLVALYSPTEKTLENVRSIRAVEPIALTKLADLPADH